MKTITINNLKHGPQTCFVDDEDHKWIEETGAMHMNDSGYAVVYVRGSKPYRKARLARLIMARYQPLEAGMYVDHINGQRLDNRRSNLRICSFKDNLRNRAKIVTAKTRSLYKGVRPLGPKWQARIEVDDKQMYLGTFATQVEAARAYNVAASKHFGEYARLNPI